MSCHLCKILGGRTTDFSNWSLADQRKHSELHRSQFVNDAVVSVGSLFEQCFKDEEGKDLNIESGESGGKNGGGENDARNEKRSNVPGSPITWTSERERRGTAIQKYSLHLERKYGRDGAIKCRLCSTSIRVHRCSYPALHHALRRHFQRVLFTCQFCPAGYSNRKSISGHIKRVHNAGAAGRYVDHTKRFESEIMALLSKCYDRPSKTSLGSRKRVKASTSCGFKRNNRSNHPESFDETFLETDTSATAKRVKSIPEPARLAAVEAGDKEKRTAPGASLTFYRHGQGNPIQRHCTSLQHRYGQDGAIKCQLCSKTVKTFKASSHAIRHALALHFKRALFTCKVCSAGCSNRLALFRHMYSVHHVSATGRYVDDSEKFEPEIIALLSKCYEPVDKASSESRSQPKKVVKIENHSTRPVKHSNAKRDG